MMETLNLGLPSWVMRHSTLLSLVGAYFGAGADWEGHEVLSVAFYRIDDCGTRRPGELESI
jgi:hypothetical protein